jgi:ABC-type multidrug transport system fused ATPase/permease subunit
VTATLDPEFEVAIYATIQRLARQRTVIMVTHRLASVAFVDRLAVMARGQVIGQWQHEELLAQVRVTEPRCNAGSIARTSP